MLVCMAERAAISEYMYSEQLHIASDKETAIIHIPQKLILWLNMVLKCLSEYS